jgi:1,2-diacylglycerol 3-alpha-glucosyltransferase
MRAETAADAPRVLFVCSGLEHARRGFESFARECFDVLRRQPGLRIELVKGSGPAGPGERALPTLRRDRIVARALGRALKVRPFRLEALAFAFSLQPVLLARRPDVVFLSEWDTARGLSLMRSVTGQRFKLLLSNGTLAAGGFEHLDCVQELTPAAQEYVLARGADPRRHVVLPLGFHIEPELTLPSPAERRALRDRLDLPPDRRVVVSVAALNRYHKRLDYLIEEVASLPEPRPFVLLLGQPEEETHGLRALARERLGEANHSIRTVPAEQVSDHCRASDVFVLASVFEGLPRALIEASALGLPCLTHAYPVTEFALGPRRYGADLTKRGALAAMLSGLSDDDLGAPRALERHRYAYEQFSWDRLTPRYVELLREVAAPAWPLAERTASIGRGRLSRARRGGHRVASRS